MDFYLAIGPKIDGVGIVGFNRNLIGKAFAFGRLLYLAEQATPLLGPNGKPLSDKGADQAHFLELNEELSQQWPVITARKEPPTDAADWDGQPDKLQYLER